MKIGILFFNVLSTLMFFSCHGQSGEEHFREIKSDMKNVTKEVIELEILHKDEICFATNLELIYTKSDSLGKGQLLLEEVNFPISTLECCGFWVTPFIRIENSFDDNKGAWKTLFKYGVYVSSKEMTCSNQDDFQFLETDGYKRLIFDVTKFPNQYLRTFIWQHTGENVQVEKVDNLWVWKQEDFNNEENFSPVWCSDDEYTIRLKSDRMAVELDIQ